MLRNSSLILSGMTLTADINDVVPTAIKFRHELHAHPELSFEEYETAERVVAQLETIPNLEIQTGIAKTGIVATLNRDVDGPCVLLRCELDALPMQEENDLSYKSTVAGKMHACGHDGHMACLLGATRVLASMADEIPGKIKFVWQPAEEGYGGGKVMIDEGVLENPSVDAAFALHGWPYLPLGTVGVHSGPTMASADFFTLTIKGQGTHAAYPHRGNDPVIIGAQIIQAAQTIVTRATDPLDSVVVSVTQFHAGTAHNIIADRATLTGTIRTLRESVRTATLQRFEALARGIAESFGATIDIDWGGGYPVVVNDTACAALVGEVAKKTLGEEILAPGMRASMGGEDFAYFAQKVPSAFWRLGVATQDAATQPTLHQANYDFPDEAVAIGIRMHCAVALEFLRRRNGALP